MIQSKIRRVNNNISIPKPTTTILTSGKKEWGDQPNDVSSIHVDQQEEEAIEDNNYSVNGDEGSVEASVHDSIQADSPSVDSVETVSDDDEDETSAAIDDPPGHPEGPKDDG